MLPNQISSMKELFQHSFFAWHDNLRILFPYAFFCSIISLAFIRSPYLAQFELHELIQHAHLNHYEPLYWDLGLSLLFALLSILTYTILLTKTNSVLNQTSLSALATIRHAFAKLPFLFMGLCLAILSLTVGFLAFAVPGFYILGVLFIFYPLIVIKENNVLSAFYDSFHLVRHHWWRTIASLLLPSVLLTTFSQVFSNLLINLLPDTTHFLLKFIFLVLLCSFILGFILPWLSIQTVMLLNDLTLRSKKNNILNAA